MLKYYLVMVFCSQQVTGDLNKCVEIKDTQAFSTVSECMIKGVKLSSDLTDVKNIKVSCFELKDI